MIVIFCVAYDSSTSTGDKYFNKGVEDFHSRWVATNSQGNGVFVYTTKFFRRNVKPLTTLPGFANVNYVLLSKMFWSMF